MILIIALFRSIPIFLIGAVWKKSRPATIIAALISGAIAVSTGNSNYLIIDLLAIGISTWLSISTINAFDKQRSTGVRNNPVKNASPGIFPFATKGKKIGRVIVFGVFGVVLAKLFVGPLFAEYLILKKGTPAPLAPLIITTPEIANRETPAVINPENHKKNALFVAKSIKTIVKEVDHLPTKRVRHPKEQTYDEMWKYENQIYMKHMAEEKAIYERNYERMRIESKRRADEDLNRARGIPPDQN